LERLRATLPPAGSVPQGKPTPEPSPSRWRWWIGAMLFCAAIINYIDRQTLSVLAPYLKIEHRWTNTDFATILISFRIAYTAGQFIWGRVLDRLGTRRGLSLSVAFYSVVAITTALAQGLGGFRLFRGLLGAGEAANNPGAAKAVSEWFPARERAWGVALFDSGSSIGGAIAPFLVLFLYRAFGSWRPAFVLTGSLGIVWRAAWIVLCRVSGESAATKTKDEPAVSVRELLRYRQTWGIVLGRFLLDPYWFLIAEWFALYLVSKGFRIEQSVLGFWAPFLGADLGNFFGGGLSSYWIRRGWPVGRARRAVLLIFGPSMLVLALTVFTSSYLVMILLFAYATFAYAACSTIFLSLPGDVFPPRAVGSISGLAGAGAGIGTLISTYLIGRVSDQVSFEPVMLAASVIPCLATLMFVTLVRAPKRPEPGSILLDF
jgi:ACS family hexuronate transporter-like MFS transporter